jgi:hypothetical protein
MAELQEFYRSRIKPLGPTERLTLARLILDDLDNSEQPRPYRVPSPRLANLSDSKDFAKQIIELDDAAL